MAAIDRTASPLAAALHFAKPRTHCGAGAVWLALGMAYPLYQHLLPARADKAAHRSHAIVLGINPGSAGPHGTVAREYLLKASEITFGLCTTFTLAEMFDKPGHDVSSLPPDEQRRLARENGPRILGMIAEEKPRIVFQLGLTWANLAVETYGIEPDGDALRRPGSTDQLLVPYRMGSIPWIVMMHFAARGYSHADARAVNDYALGRLEGQLAPPPAA